MITPGNLLSPQTTLIGSRGHLIQAGPIKTLPWDFGIGTERVKGRREVSA